MLSLDMLLYPQADGMQVLKFLIDVDSVTYWIN